MLIISAMTLSCDDFRPTVTNFVVRASFAGYDPARHEDLNLGIGWSRPDVFGLFSFNISKNCWQIIWL